MAGRGQIASQINRPLTARTFSLYAASPPQSRRQPQWIGRRAADRLRRRLRRGGGRGGGGEEEEENEEDEEDEEEEEEAGRRTAIGLMRRRARISCREGG